MSSAGYLLLEASVLVLFLITVSHARRRGRQYLLELISAALYGLLLELGDIALFGTYSYSRGFYLVLGWVPVSIALSWAMIIYGAMLYSDRLGLSPRLAPFADALWAVLLDLSIDVVAIRLGLWHWRIPLDAGYFGVPAGNFYSWLFVALSFSAISRWFRRRPGWGQLWAPLPAYIGLLTGLIPFIIARSLLYPSSRAGAGLELFALTATAFALVVAQSIWRQGLRPKGPADGLTTVTRWAMHLYFLGVYFWLGLLVELPFLLSVALGLLATEAALLVPLALPSWRSTAPELTAPKEALSL